MQVDLCLRWQEHCTGRNLFRPWSWCCVPRLGSCVRSLTVPSGWYSLRRESRFDRRGDSFNERRDLTCVSWVWKRERASASAIWAKQIVACTGPSPHLLEWEQALHWGNARANFRTELRDVESFVLEAFACEAVCWMLEWLIEAVDGDSAGIVIGVSSWEL